METHAREMDLKRGVQDLYSNRIDQWFRQLSERLRYVRVVCGDWSRVCGGNWQDGMGSAGIFFDPPYGVEDRAAVYTTEDFTISGAVRAWCIERGSKKSYRIVLAGYEDEHAELLEHGWTQHRWSAAGGYGNQGKGKKGEEDGQGAKNRHRETLFFSPHCRRLRVPGGFGLK